MRMLIVLAAVLFSSAYVNLAVGQKVVRSHSTNRQTEEPLSEGVIRRSQVDSVLMTLRQTTAATKRADICFSLSQYFASYLKIDSALFYSDKVREESEAARYEVGMGKYYLSRSIALMFRNIRQPEGFTKAIDIFTRHQQHYYTGLAYKMLAMQYLNANDVARSRPNFHLSIHYLLKAGNQRMLEQSYCEASRTFSKVNQRDSAAWYLFTALNLAEKINDPLRIFIAAGELGELYNIANDMPAAIRYLEYSLRVKTPAISKILVREPLGEYADALLKIGEFTKAWAAIEEYEETCRKLRDPWGSVMLKSLKGRYFYHKKEYATARSFLEPAYQEMLGMDNILDLKSVAYFLAKTEYEQGNHDAAIRHYLKALQLDDDQHTGQNVLDASLGISLAYEHKRMPDSALYYLRRYNLQNDSLVAATREKTVMELTARYETEKKEHQIQILQRESALNTLQLKAQTGELERQRLLDQQKSQQLALLSQQNEISRLEGAQKSLALESQKKETAKKENELILLEKEKELQKAIAAQETQRNRFAYLAVIAVLLFSGYVFYRYLQTRRLSARLADSLANLHNAQEQLIRIEKEKEAENIRVRISRDIHDEVGATLSGVALFSEIARQKMEQQNPGEAQAYLDHITANSKEMVDKMSDIVWAINPENDSMERIIAKLHSYAFNLCAGKGIVLHTAVDETVRDYYPSMHEKRNLYLFVKEAVNNAVKYSEARNIWLSLQRSNGSVCAEVKDDGIGFDTASPRDGNGLRNMQARADSLKGTCLVRSHTDTGTTVSLNFHPGGGHAVTV